MCQKQKREPVKPKKCKYEENYEYGIYVYCSVFHRFPPLPLQLSHNVLHFIQGVTHSQDPSYSADHQDLYRVQRS